MNKFFPYLFFFLIQPFTSFSHDEINKIDSSTFRFQKDLQIVGFTANEEQSNFTHCAYDSLGRLWLTHKNQISIFDGNNFLSMDVDIKGDITFQKANKKWMWFGTDSLEFIGFSNGLKYSSRIPLTTEIDRIVDIRLLRNSKVLISCYSGAIFLYDYPTDHLKKIAYQSTLNFTIYAVCPLGERAYLWATDQGILHFQLSESARLTKADYSSSDILCTEIKRKESEIFIGTHSGLIEKFNIDNKELIWSLETGNQAISEINFQGDKLYALNTSEKIFTLACSITEDDKIPCQLIPSKIGKKKWRDLDFYNLTEAVFLDNKGRLYSYQNWVDKLILSLGNIQSLDLSQDSLLMIGSENGAYIAILKKNTLTQVEKIHSGNVISVHSDKYGNRWVGTFGNGLFQYHNKKLIDHFNLQSGIPDNSILSIDSDNSFCWIGTLGGIARIEINSGKVSNIPLNIGAQYIYHIEKNDDRLYFSTDGNNMGYITETSKGNFQTILFSDKNTVYTFDLTNSNEVLYPELNSGLYKYEDGKKQLLLPDSTIRMKDIGSLIYQDSLIIMVTQNGILLYNFKSKKFMFLNQVKGCDLANHILNASTQKIDKYRYVASGNCILRLKLSILDQIKVAKITPLYIEVNGKHISYQDRSKFKYWENALTFCYIGASPIRNNHLRYQFKIDGIHNRWNSTTDHILSFSKIPPGNYTFRIRPVGREGVYRNSEWSYNFSIDKKWWWEWWFLLIIAFLLALIIYMYFRWREKNKLRYIQLKQDKVQAQLEAIRSQVNPHFLFNSFNTLMSLIESHPERASAFTENLSSFYRQLLQVQPSELLSFEKELSLTYQYIQLMRTRFPEGIFFTENVKNKTFYLIPYTLQILAENAIKHNTISDDDPLRIELFDDGDYLIIKNTHSPNFTESKGEGFGLKSINERYQYKMNESIKVVHEKKLFKVIIPKIYKYENSHN